MAISVKAEAEITTGEERRAKRFMKFPLSAKFVFKILEYNGLLTQK